jgi:predicted ArsR family transcriptional regulator
VSAPKKRSSAREALRSLREERRAAIATTRDRVKHVTRLQSLVVEALTDGPLTVPELAEKSGVASSEALWHLMALKRFGRVVEVEKVGRTGYYRYGLAPEQVDTDA